MRVNYKNLTGVVVYDMDTDLYCLQVSELGKIYSSADPHEPDITTPARGGMNPLFPLYDKFRKAVDELIVTQETSNA